MSNIQADDTDTVQTALRQARTADHIQRAQIMLIAAGLTAFGIVAVAAAMMTTLL